MRRVKLVRQVALQLIPHRLDYFRIHNLSARVPPLSAV